MSGNGVATTEATRRQPAYCEGAGIEWAAMAEQGHLFPDRCPTWSGAGVVPVNIKQSVLSQPTQEFGIAMVCGCGAWMVTPMRQAPPQAPARS